MKNTNGIVTKYVYGKGLIGEQKCDEGFKTYHFDYRGSTVAITDQSGNITDTFKYDAYGNMTQHIGNSFVIFGYDGRDGVVSDKNGLTYMRARYYSPAMRRFVNSDAPDYVAVTGGNLFNYCANCSTKNADYLGFCYTPTYEEDKAQKKTVKIYIQSSAKRLHMLIIIIINIMIILRVILVVNLLD